MEKQKSNSFNELGVESFILGCFGGSMFSFGLLIAPIFFNILGFVFSGLALVLAVYAFVDWGKNGNRGCYGFAIAGAAVAVCIPTMFMILRMYITFLA